MATATQASDHIFISISRFRDLIASGIITRMPAGKYSLDKVREQYCRNAQKRMQGRLDEDGASLSKQRTRLAKAQAVAAEMRNAVARGDLASIKEMGRALEREFCVVRERVLSTAGMCADALTPHCAESRAAIFTILEDQAHAALNDLSTATIMEELHASYAARHPERGDDNTPDKTQDDDATDDDATDGDA